MGRKKQKIIVIVGPTATGKSALAVRLARKLGGEIISADSRQVYRGLDIGTAKITKREMHGVPHHLLDVASPSRQFTVVHFKKLADKALQSIALRKKLPIVVGGTGFYIQALVDNIVLPEVKPNLKLRKQLEKKSVSELFKTLKKLDPARAKTIEAKNLRRLIRAIEIAKALGKVPTLESQRPGRYLASRTLKPLFIGLTLSPVELKKKIATRLKKRLRQGLIAEVKKLRRNRLSWKRLHDLGLEYRLVAEFLRDVSSRNLLFWAYAQKRRRLKQKLLTEIYRYAKRQMTWWKRDKRIKWFNPDGYKSVENKTHQFLETSDYLNQTPF